MDVVVYYPKENQEQIDALGAMHAGIPGAGYKPLESYTVREAPDVAAVFGVYEKTDPYSAFVGRIAEVQHYLGKRTLVLTKGFVKRDEYYAVGWGGKKGWADFCSRNSPSDRAKALGVELKPWNLDGEHYLLIGQVPWGADTQHVQHFEWVANTLIRLRLITDTPVVFRPHPSMEGDATELYNEMRSQGVIVDTEHKPISESLEKAKIVLTFNSNVGVDALLAGKPVLAFDEGSMVYEASRHHVEYILDPGLILAGLDRQRWLNDLAYAQWTPAEMESGEAWRHIGVGALEEAA